MIELGRLIRHPSLVELNHESRLHEEVMGRLGRYVGMRAQREICSERDPYPNGARALFPSQEESRGLSRFGFRNRLTTPKIAITENHTALNQFAAGSGFIST